MGANAMALELISTMGSRNGVVHLRYGERQGDPTPFILTIHPEYVARKTSKALPIKSQDVTQYVAAHAADLKTLAEDQKARGYNMCVLE